MRKEILLAPCSGIVSQILTHSGSKVAEGQELINLEVMKLFYSVTALLSGSLTLIITEGQFVAEGEELGFILEDS
jgi:biotin carboxyl carrier protein